MRSRQPIQIRFWRYAKKNETCWFRTGGIAHGPPNDYGQIRIAKKLRPAHHVAFYIETGRWPVQKLLHKCDNPRCVRFEHLFEGTQRANILDAIHKGRWDVRGWARRRKAHCG